jgi:PBP1b-binding outer membrane lipoprotein LpoB
MKTKSIVLLCAMPLFLSGCVATSFEKSVVVTKDASGKIVSRIETERVIQPNRQASPVSFEYLTGL